jgi:hypothetical protein
MLALSRIVRTCAVLGACTVLAALAAPARAVVTTFDNGTEGWTISGRDTISPTGGNPGANLDVFIDEAFGAQTRNDSNPAFLGDLSRYGSPLKFAIDFKVNSIRSIPNGDEIPRDLVVELVDYNPPGSNYPYVSAWFNFGEIGSHLPGWRHFEVTIDPNQAALPAGWGGTGDEDPVTFEPRLPPDRTFASVLQSVDEVRFTTMVPGFFYAFTTFEVQADNIEISAVPEPASLGLLACAGLMALRRRRA